MHYKVRRGGLQESAGNLRNMTDNFIYRLPPLIPVSRDAQSSERSAGTREQSALRSEDCASRLTYATEIVMKHLLLLAVGALVVLALQANAIVRGGKKDCHVGIGKTA